MIDKQASDCDRSIFTLDRPINYQIKIAGQLSENWSELTDQMDIHFETDPSGYSTTDLKGLFDQAALLGLLRRLYYLGFPLISVNCVQPTKKNKD